MSAKLPLLTMTSLAWRNLMRNRERSAIMAGALTIAVGAMIFLIAMMRGMMGDMQSQTIQGLPGDIQIHAPEFRNDPDIEYHFRSPTAELQSALNSPLIKAWSERIKVSAMISSERVNRGVEIIAFNAQQEGHDAFGNIVLTEGQWLDEGSGIIVGKTLLEKLETNLGKRVVLITRALDGSTAEIGMPIVGVYRAEMRAKEESQIYISLSKAQQWLGLEGNIQEISVYANNPSQLSSIQQQLKLASPDLEVMRWDELIPYMSAMLKSSDAMITVLTVIIFVTLSFGLVNTLVMAIFERTKEIGLMLALGLQPRQISLLIMSEMLVLLLIGLLLGDLIAGSILYHLSAGIDLSQFAEGLAMMGVSATLTPIFLWHDLLMCNGIVIFLGLASSLLPAWKASHLKPIEALYRD